MTTKIVLSRLGFERHTSNPFVAVVDEATQTRTKRITSKGGDRLMIVGRDTGEIHGPAGFWQAQEVDKTQFVKLYVNGVKAFKELTGAGTKVFELLYLAIQQNIGKDEVVLSFGKVDQKATPLSQKTFIRGVKELLEKDFIAESMTPSVYFVNPDFVWNGDRLSFVKSYRLKQDYAKAVKDTKTLDLFHESENEKVNEIIAKDSKARENNQ